MNLNSSMLNNIGNVLAGTPWWVWCILGYLLFIGYKSTKKREVYIPKLFIIPSILVILKYKIFLTIDWCGWLLYIACFVAAAMIGSIIAKNEKVSFKKSLTIVLPGTYQILVLLLVFFSIKYFFGYLHATNPDLAAHFSKIELSVNALLSGYFMGKALSYLKSYKTHSIS